MQDNEYIFAYYLKENSAQAARLAVLYPLVRIDEELNPIEQRMFTAGQALLTQWRARTVALREAGWSRLEGIRMQYARNCWPGGMLGLPSWKNSQTRFCRQYQVCPWCYARRVREAYDRVYDGAQDLALQEGQQPQDYRLVSTMGLIKLPATVGGDEIRHHLEKETTLLRMMARKNRQHCPGSYVSVMAYPALNQDRQTIEFLVSSRTLFLVRGNARVRFLEKDWQVRDGEGKKGVHQPDWPVGSRVLTHIARVCRYAVPLMRSPPADTIRALEARNELRLSEFGGVFRRQATVDEGETHE